MVLLIKFTKFKIIYAEMIKKRKKNMKNGVGIAIKKNGK
jgi:hypothetical protein